MDYNTAVATTNATHNTELWWIVAISVTLVYIIYGLILAYHWSRYSLNNIATVMAIVLYGAIGLLLVATLIINVTHL